MRTQNIPTINANCEHFDSVQEFIAYLDKREPNKAFASEYFYKSSGWRFFRSTDDNLEFRGTKSWEEAQELLAKGYPEGTKKILEGNAKLTMKNTGRPRREIAMVGGQAHVPNAIIGLPKTMIQRVKQPMPQRTISIFYDCSASSAVEKETLFEGGAGVYTLIKHLEGKGLRVQLHIFKGCTTRSRDHISVATIKVKDFKQPINPLLVSYPLTHASFFRRHLIRYMEVSEHTSNSDYADCCGRTLRGFYRGGNRFSEFLRQNNIIGKDDIYLDCESVAQCNHIESIINLANISAGHKVI